MRIRTSILERKGQNANRNHLVVECLIGVLIGCCAFIIIYGIKVLDVTDDTWILSGYAEWDVQQHYAGWVNFRNSNWRFPLGQANQIGYPSYNGVNIAFTDSIPILSIFFKLIRFALPQTFQFFGIYSLTIFILQGIAATLLLNQFNLKRKYIVVGTIFFVLSPIMLERNFRHMALASHYLILFSILLYFAHRKTHKLPWISLILSIFSVGITPYFLPMVMVFIFLISLENIISTKKLLRPILYFLSNIFIALFTAYCIGAIGNGYSSSRDGYGYYSMNINALINPTSCGGYIWSQILPIRPQMNGQYDGFNYLGVGCISLCIVVLIAWIIQIVRGRANVVPFAKRNSFLILVAIFLTAFSISNVICFDDMEIISISFPQRLLSLCGMFRASSRIFYPVFYLIILSGIVGIARLFEKLNFTEVRKNIIAISVLSIFLILQIYDLSGLLAFKHHEMALKTSLNLLPPEELLNLHDFDELFVTQNWGTRYETILAAKNRLVSNGIDSNTGTDAYAPCYDHTNIINQQLCDGILQNNIVYSTRNESEYISWTNQYTDQATFYIWDLNKENVSVWSDANKLYFMVPNQK